MFYDCTTVIRYSLNKVSVWKALSKPVYFVLLQPKEPVLYIGFSKVRGQGEGVLIDNRKSENRNRYVFKHRGHDNKSCVCLRMCGFPCKCAQSQAIATVLWKYVPGRWGDCGCF